MFIRAILFVLLLVGAFVAAVVPFTGPQRPHFPMAPAYGVGSSNGIKYRPGEFYRGTIQGPRSVRGLQRVNSIRADLHFQEGPSLSLPVKSNVQSDEWEDVIRVEKRYDVAPISIPYEAGPFPDDPRLAGAPPTLTVIADLSYPAKISEEAFESKSESSREIVTLSFFAPGEFEKLEDARRQSDLEWARAREAFARKLTLKRTVWWGLAAVCLLLAGGVALFPRFRWQC